ncbi:hypothetical protein CAPTEDRAFT_207345 [Capitella teleta]|uniref:Uncharacterized protein n=1 Tax=Capitella teleta TaxID=283909 RepID=R7UF02_CAPTE|nr:hypothetical protein CAPTEDRAFT_207345 [Capitella teleta]|eukprot:ELU04549.1 hypothetical protein CAPTEDRAFT_207345 [Capitella teleta]
MLIASLAANNQIVQPKSLKGSGLSGIPIQGVPTSQGRTTTRRGPGQVDTASRASRGSTKLLSATACGQIALEDAGNASRAPRLYLDSLVTDGSLQITICPLQEGEEAEEEEVSLLALIILYDLSLISIVDPCQCNKRCKLSAPAPAKNLH